MLQNSVRAEVERLKQQLTVEQAERVAVEGELANCQAGLRHLKGARPKPGDALLLAALLG